ncbi:hypothetical protein PF003_g7262 [Phytophthora fragariae]|nr:hypothetical protein PF003_g7262 [Phytophthora fragariae]
MGFIAASLASDASGAVFVKPMDRFGVQLAFVEERVGKPLSKNFVMSCFRRVKKLSARHLPGTPIYHEEEVAHGGEASWVRVTQLKVHWAQW